MKKTYIIFICFFILPRVGFCQNDGGATKITIFKPEDAKPVTTGNPADRLQEKNNIKWNYSLLSRGVFLLNYEFYLNSKLTGEVGAGLTLRDYIFEAFKGQFFLDNYSYGASSNPGFCGEGGIRFYPKGFDNFEGVFLSPIISYRNYALGSQSLSSNRTTKTSFVPGYKFLDLQFKFGYQYESIWSEDLYGEIYIGFALRKATVNYLQESYNINNTVIYTPTEAKESFAQPLFGFKIGVPF